MRSLAAKLEIALHLPHEQSDPTLSCLPDIFDVLALLHKRFRPLLRLLYARLLVDALLLAYETGGAQKLIRQP